MSLSGGLCLWSHFWRHRITPAESTLISISKVLSGSHIVTVFHGAPSKLWHITHTCTCTHTHTHMPQRLTFFLSFSVAFFWCWICLQGGNTCCKQPLYPHLWTFSSIFQDFSYILVPSKTCSEKYFWVFQGCGILLYSARGRDLTILSRAEKGRVCGLNIANFKKANWKERWHLVKY